MPELHRYSIMPCDAEHAVEIAADIARQYRDGIADTALIMMTLTPEDDPPLDKAALLCRGFDAVRAALDPALPLGVLVQATIGHGYALDRRSAFPKIVGLQDGVERETCCPYDEGFRAFFRKQFRTIAEHRPSVIMLDDDFRLMNRAGHGCACPMHLRALAEKLGRESITREETLAAANGTSAEDRRITEAFIETQIESLTGCARAMRQGIDDVDETLPGVFCLCGNACEGAAEIARIMAGKGNPTVLRLNNGRYTCESGHGFTTAMLRAAVQAAVVKGKADVLLAETDTCPQNRYSTDAMQLHSHFTGTILEGAAGAKHWITRLHAWEPGSGEVYRRTLGKYSGFYGTLAALVPELKPFGCRVPLTSRPGYGFASSPSAMDTGWSHHVLERIGLPLYFSDETGGATVIDDCDPVFTDDELLGFFRGTVWLSGPAALRLQERGFGYMLGVRVSPWEGEHLSGELLPNGNSCGTQKDAYQLTPLSAAVRADSTVYHLKDGTEIIPCFPGVTVYDNPLGGRTVVFCGTPRTAFRYTEAFSFLNESRKAQLIALLRAGGDLPLWCVGDAEIYLRAGKLPDGAYFAALFNLSYDPTDGVTLGVDRAVARAETLRPDGSWEVVPFTQDGEVLTMSGLSALPMCPLVLRLS